MDWCVEYGTETVPPILELVCSVLGFGIPNTEAIPPHQKLPSSDTQDRVLRPISLLKSRLKWPSKLPTGAWVCGTGSGAIHQSRTVDRYPIAQHVAVEVSQCIR